MIARALIPLSFVAAVLAVPTVLSLREDAPTDSDLLASCPGGPGSSNIERADRCTLINIVNNPDTRIYKALGDPQLNCGGGTDDVTVTLGGETSVSQTVSVSANLGFNIEGISVGGGLETSDTSTQTQSKSHHSQSGQVQVNYPDRQFDHFIWFTGTSITQLTPTDDVVFDVYESACGTDPNDFSSLH
ncbi:uncharacterized protein BXZ73DRAFT_91898 [Epithele typhae]|uniref:uncharacterized protein n=1 Tax=Epithele typhae TaxID=378194 RepID=UPI0020073075|nr:uncharacterized protein BXZ73DRAFT_91898 [Epithele typhae]KAH9920887.1 hypothetical protein BXZ73DRAFT_91898 [Epithele typhae]